MVNFANLDSDKGLTELNHYLADKSYIEGYQPTQADVSVFKQVGKAPDAHKYVYASRWFSHIGSFTENERSAFHAAPQVSTSTTTSKKDEDEIDLFGEDENDEEYEKELEERRKAAEAAKGPKKDKPIAKSSLVIDVKPWDDETPMDKLEESVRSVTIEGLVWGASKFVPVGYGIKKLQIGAVVVDDLVSIEDLEEQITAFGDYVQSMDVVAFNKI